MSADASQIRTASGDWVCAFNAKDGAGIAAVYTADAVLLPPDAAPIEGLEAISGFWGDFAGSVDSARLEIQEMFVDGDLANVIGTFKLEVAGEQPLTGKYVEMWTRGEAGWRMHRDIWNATP